MPRGVGGLGLPCAFGDVGPCLTDASVAQAIQLCSPSAGMRMRIMLAITAWVLAEASGELARAISLETAFIAASASRQETYPPCRMAALRLPRGE